MLKIELIGLCTVITSHSIRSPYTFHIRVWLKFITSNGSFYTVLVVICNFWLLPFIEKVKGKTKKTPQGAKFRKIQLANFSFILRDLSRSLHWRCKPHQVQDAVKKITIKEKLPHNKFRKLTCQIREKKNASHRASYDWLRIIKEIKRDV